MTLPIRFSLFSANSFSSALSRSVVVFSLQSENTNCYGKDGSYSDHFHAHVTPTTAEGEEPPESNRRRKCMLSLNWMEHTAIIIIISCNGNDYIGVAYALASTK